MKKIYFLFLFALVASLTGANAQTTIFYESFDQCNGTGGNDGVFNGSVANSAFNPDNDGWTANSSFGAKQCAKFGASKVTGTATTPALTGLNGNATLTFKAAPWGSEGTTLNLSISGGGSLSLSSVTMTANQLIEFSVDIIGGTSESKITFTPVKRFFLDEVKIVSAAPANEVTAPIITGVVNGQTYANQATVGISYPELATSITYSITKEGDTEMPQTVTAAVEQTITEPGQYTVKASATDGTVTKYAEAVTFTIVEPKAANINEFISLGGQLGDGVEIEFTCPLTVTYQNGTRLYVKDAEGSALLVLGSVGQTYANGDVIPAGTKGTYTLYSGNTPEMANPAGFVAATETTEANPVEKTVTTVAASDINQYIIIKGVTVDATAKTVKDADNNTIAFYDRFRLNNAPADENTYNVTAIVEIYSNAPQIAPIEFEAAQITSVAAPEFSLEEGTYNTAQTLVITSATEGATITYMVDGLNVVDEAQSPVTIELPVAAAATTYTVTAQASLGNLTSEEVTKIYVIDPNASVELTATIDISEVAVANSWVDGNSKGGQYQSFEEKGFQFAIDATDSNSGKYYSTGNQSWRVFNDAKLTITSPANTTIKNLTFIKDSCWGTNLTADNGTVSEDLMTWTADSETSTVTFTFTAEPGTSKNRFDISKINITYISTPAGVESIESGKNVITVNGGNIVVNAATATVANVYNAAGQLVRSAKVDGETKIAVPAGFYVVKAGNSVAKVIVK